MIEIHDVPAWGDPFWFSAVENFFAKLTNHFFVVHNHPTNASNLFKIGNFVAPTTFELTFIRKDRVKNLGFVTEFPHIKDYPCVPELPEIILPRNWYYNEERK